jgi:hypothetical protein
LILTSAAATAFSSTLQGHVTDSEGAVIKDAHIFLRSDLAGGFAKKSTDRTLATDANGRFSADLAQGFYDVCVMADGFSPQCRKVFLADQSKNQQSFSLQVDPEVTKRIGDRF